MLKIKDNVDLKELEKFGFEYKGKENVKKYRGWFSDNRITQVLNCDNRIITGNSLFNFDDELSKHLTTLFDLIQAGLIEKVAK